MVLCCKCGIEILPTYRNMCTRCLKSEIDISAGIKQSIFVETCRGCGRYHIPPGKWKEYAWGSKDLLIFLLGRNKTLKKKNIIDSSFVYSEEHSKKITVEIVILEERIEQAVCLTFTIRNRQCVNCRRFESSQYWKTIVQLRQTPHHRRTFMYIEQLILAHKAHLGTSNIKERPDGIDFCYQTKKDAQKMLDFLCGYFPIKVSHSSQLISEDRNNNTANQKFSYAARMVPFCKDDLVYIEGKDSSINRFILITKVRNTVEYCDPASRVCGKMTSAEYFSNEYGIHILMRSGSFSKYEVLLSRLNRYGTYDVTLCPCGNQNITYDLQIGMRLCEGDIVLGYDIKNSTLSVEIDLPLDVVVVRIAGDDGEDEEEAMGKDNEFRYFLEDISSDKQLMKSVAKYNPNVKLIKTLMNQINFSPSI